MEYTRQHQAAERVAMRRWLAKHGIDQIQGTTPSHKEQLMKQVLKFGGDPHSLMAEGRAKVDARREKLSHET